MNPSTNEAPNETNKQKVEIDHNPFPPEARNFLKAIPTYSGFILLNLIFFSIQHRDGIFGELNKQDYNISITYLAVIYIYGFLISFYQSKRPLILGAIYYLFPALLFLINSDLPYVSTLDFWFSPLTHGFFYQNPFSSYELSGKVLLIAFISFIAGYFSRCLLKKSLNFFKKPG